MSGSAAALLPQSASDWERGRGVDGAGKAGGAAPERQQRRGDGQERGADEDEEVMLQRVDFELPKVGRK